MIKAFFKPFRAIKIGAAAPLYHKTGGIHKAPINDPKRQSALRVENTLAQRHNTRHI
jgi:hypothetical protein